MATPTEKWKSSGHLTKQNTFLKQGKRFGNRSVLFEDGFSTPACPQHLRVMQLQQDLAQLQERERRVKQRNRQLLQQFEQAQSALEEIMACNTTMRAIRMEYERYLEDSAPRWELQFKEKTEAAQQERMEKHLKLRLEEAEDPVLKFSADDSCRSQGAQKAVAPQACPTPEHRSIKDGYPYPFTQYSWLTHPRSQTGKFPIVGLNPPPLLSSPSTPHPFLVHPFSSAFPPYPLSSKDPAVLDSSQHGSPWLAGPSVGFHGYNEEPHPEVRGSQNGEQNSKRRGGSRSGHLFQELDIKPVRLSSRHSDSSESSRGPTLFTKGKSGKNRGSVELSSSDINSEESSRTPSVTASVAESQVLKHPSSDKSSFRKTHKSDGITATSPRSEKKVKERTEKRRSEKRNGEKQHSEEESGSSSEGLMREKEGKQRHGEESKSGRREKFKKDDKKIQSEAAGEKDKQGRGSWEQMNAKEEVPNNLSSEEEKCQKSQKQENRDKDSYRETTTEEEAGMEAEEEHESEDEDSEEEDEGEDKDAEEEDEGEDKDAEEEDEGEDEDAEEEDEGEDKDAGMEAEEEDGDDEEAGTAAEDEEQPKEFEDEKTEESSQDEDEEEMESSEKKNKEEEPKSDEEDKTDSDDSIISPQNKRNVEKEFHLVLVTPAEEDLLQSSTQMQTIPETATEEEEEDENAAESSDEDDVENVLAPQDRQQKDASHVDLFRVMEARRKTERHSDSDEFDHFYD